MLFCLGTTEFWGTVDFRRTACLLFFGNRDHIYFHFNLPMLKQYRRCVFRYKMLYLVYPSFKPGKYRTAVKLYFNDAFEKQVVLCAEFDIEKQINNGEAEFFLHFRYSIVCSCFRKVFRAKY